MDHRSDVVIVGAGLAGLTAALFAAKAGLSTVVLEKADRVGGASCWSYGAIWVGTNDLAASAGIADDPNEVASYLDFLGGGAADPARTDALTGHAPTMLRTLRNWGVPIDLMPGVNDILFGKAPGAAREGRTLEPPTMAGSLLGDWRHLLSTPPGDEWRLPKSVVARLTDPAEVAARIAEAVAEDQLAQGASLVARIMVALRGETGVDLRTGVAVDAILHEEGRVIGVRTGEDGRWLARHGVVLTTGSYLAKSSIVDAIDGLPDYRAWCPATSTGDGLVMAASIGAQIRSTRNNLAVMLGYDDPGDPDALAVGAPSVRELPRAHVIVVNAAGQRFGNEGVFQELAPALREFDVGTRRAKNLPCWMVFDATYVDRWGLAGSPPGMVPDWVIRGSDLDGLASAAGIDAPGLRETVARFNGFAASGIDGDFGRKPGWALTPGVGSGRNPSLGAIETTPFYAVRLFPTLGVAGGGLKADGQARVTDWRGDPIAGLYAAGDVAAHDEFGTGYQAGLTFTAAMTFAMIAINHIQDQTDAL